MRYGIPTGQRKGRSTLTQYISASGNGAVFTMECPLFVEWQRPSQLVAWHSGCKDRPQYKCPKYLLTKPSNNIDVFVIFRWSFTLAIFEAIAETTQEILEN